MTGIDVRDDAHVAAAHRFRMWKLVSQKFERISLFVDSAINGRMSLSSLPSAVANAFWVDIGPSAHSLKNGLGKSKTAQALTAAYPLWPHLGRDERDQFKMLLDMDGWGWSARYRELLKAPGAVLKSTVFRESENDEGLMYG